jgi:hypothetical protein
LIRCDPPAKGLAAKDAALIIVLLQLGSYE